VVSGGSELTKPAAVMVPESAVSQGTNIKIMNSSAAVMSGEKDSIITMVAKHIFLEQKFIGEEKEMDYSFGTRRCLAFKIAMYCRVPEDYIEPWWGRNKIYVNPQLNTMRANARSKLESSYFSKCILTSSVNTSYYMTNLYL